MGAWGYGSFDNDDASDLIADLLQTADMSVVSGAFRAVMFDADGYIEAPACSMAIAAAEVVASLVDSDTSRLPEELAEWIEGRRLSDSQVVAHALNAITAIADGSELKEIWEENADDYPLWMEALSTLASRLAAAAN